MSKDTIHEYDIQGKYGLHWETVTTEETFVEAKEMLKCYNENEPVYPHRIKRVKI